jgi:hypothetical protein
MVHQKHFGLVSAIICIAALALLLPYAPSYLKYAEKPSACDCIVLLIGPENVSRQERAREILGKGYTNCLIIPALGKLATGPSSLGLVTGKSEHAQAPLTDSLCEQWQYRLMENTQLEILLAKKSMDRHSMKSVIFVSSPYHMRRVRIIADSVFGHGEYRTAFVPGNHENNEPSAWWILDGHDLWWVSSEYLKIAWFLVYDGMHLFPDTLVERLESAFTWRDSDPIC